MLDCIVVGAGIAGLVAARDLMRKGKDVVVLEARPRVGGRIEAVPLPDGELIDLGGQWVSDGHEMMLELLDEYDRKPVEDVPGDLVVLMNGCVSRLRLEEADRRILTPFELADLGQGLQRFRRLAERMTKDAAWAEANRAWLEQPLQRWVESNLRTSKGQERFRQAFSVGYAAQSEDASLRDALEWSLDGVDLETLITVEGSLVQFRVQGSLGDLLDTIADELGERVHVDSPVSEIASTDDSVRVTLTNGDVLEAKHVIVALLPHLAAQLSFDPPLPQKSVDMVLRVPRGHVIKAFLVYPHPWWRDQGLGGQFSADEGAVRVGLDVSTESGLGVLMGFFEGEQAETLGKRSETMRQRAFEASVERIFGTPPVPATAYLERDWMLDPYTGGTFGAHFAPSIWTVAGPKLNESKSRVHFAGAEYASQYNGYMEGALLSAADVVSDVLRLL